MATEMYSRVLLAVAIVYRPPPPPCTGVDRQCHGGAVGRQLGITHKPLVSSGNPLAVHVLHKVRRRLVKSSRGLPTLHRHRVEISVYYAMK